MRYVRSETLETLLQDCIKLTASERLGQSLKLLDVLIDVCETLTYTHAKSVIRRDRKLRNVIRGEFGETIVLNLSLAQLFADSDIIVTLSCPIKTGFTREVIYSSTHKIGIHLLCRPSDN